MRSIGEKLNHIFSSYMIFFMLIAAVIGWKIGDGLSGFRNWVPFLFGFTTFVTSSKISFENLTGIIKRPYALLTIIVLQHTVFPFFAEFIGKLGFPDNQGLITGFILTAALPVGVTSVIWTGLAHGDVALSLTATTLDTLLSPLVVSLTLFLFVGKTIAINYYNMIIALIIMIVIPSILGLTVNRISKGTFHPKYINFLGPLSSLCICLVIMINVGTAQATASSLVSAAPILVLLAFILVLSGYLAGWLFPTIFNFSQETKQACIFCIGIRNTSCGLVIALGHLPIQASIPLLVAMFFQQPLAAIAQRYYYLRSKK